MQVMCCAIDLTVLGAVPPNAEKRVVTVARFVSVLRFGLFVYGGGFVI
jgi:hypothetical protein